MSDYKRIERLTFALRTIQIWAEADEEFEPTGGWRDEVDWIAHFRRSLNRIAEKAKEALRDE